MNLDVSVGVVVGLLLATIFLITGAFALLLKRSPQPLYKYKAKRYVMTRTEADCYRKLQKIYADHYVIVPQVHLSAIFNHKIKGQNWRAAFFHINGKSVDFVFLDDRTLQICFALELDDSTHDRADRVARDAEVNAIFKQAGLPLYRIRYTLKKSPDQIKKDIDTQKNKHYN